jgi:hypothetical protein
VQGARTVTVTKNEILSGLNKPEAFILALVEVDGEATTCRYLRGPFQHSQEFGGIVYNQLEQGVILSGIRFA